jgi:hypothetical protein
MVHFQAEVQIESTSQQARPIIRAAVGIGSVELLTLRF